MSYFTRSCIASGFSFSNEAGGERPFADGDNLGTQRPFRAKEVNLMQDFV